MGDCRIPFTMQPNSMISWMCLSFYCDKEGKSWRIKSLDMWHIAVLASKPNVAKSLFSGVLFKTKYHMNCQKSRKLCNSNTVYNNTNLWVGMTAYPKTEIDSSTVCYGIKFWFIFYQLAGYKQLHCYYVTQKHHCEAQPGRLAWTDMFMFDLPFD